tara:strand:- start:2339 stop:4030 length:1692 start_codon:yes stop_codon:yes gene_type:complete
MIQLGIAAFFHDSSACIVKDGKVLAAAEEERFTGIKHDLAFPSNAINWVLKDTNLKISDIDEVCWYEKPELKKERILKSFKKHFLRTFFLRKKFFKDFQANNPILLLENLGYYGKIKFIDHHTSHSAFAFLTSSFDKAAVLTIDGVGEFETVTISLGRKQKNQKVLLPLYSEEFPSSLGLLYSTFTAFLGFKPNEGEYKVMGLAPYGDENKYLPLLRELFIDNSFKINQKYFTWEYSDKVMFNSKLTKLLGLQPRLPDEKINQSHKDLAASIQKIYEEKFLELVKKAKELTNINNLVLGGGCAYNGVANSKAYKYFKNIHIPFAPSDAGSSIGACLYSYYNNFYKIPLNNNPFLGPSYNDNQIRRVLKRNSDKIRWFRLSDTKLIEKTSDLLINEKIVAWFQGKMEFGARALGNRSILALPKNADMREKLNLVIKKRESFRPFAPSVTAETAKKWFYIKENIPFMNQVVKAKTFGRTTKYFPFPASTHIDGTSRVQTVTLDFNFRYYSLLKEVGRKTGSEVLLNTSFNLKDQTITLSPAQAVDRFLNSEIDFLVINNFLIQKL